MENEAYSAGLMSESFWFLEFKQAVKLRSEGMTLEEIRDRCLADNLFGYTKERRAKAVVGYILSRLRLMDDAMVQLFMTSDLQTQKLINLIMLMRKDRLFFEFIYEVYREKIIMGQPEIELADAKVFFTRKESQDADVAIWKDTTKMKLRTQFLCFMAEAGLLSINGKKRSITPPLIDIALERYLKANGENDIVRALTGGQ